MSGTILITGASSGIGRATAELFLRKGWVVGALAPVGQSGEMVFDQLKGPRWTGRWSFISRTNPSPARWPRRD